jgi:hypothetical protein
MSAIIGTVTHWYHSKRDLPSKEMVRLLRSMLERGIALEIQEYSGRSFSMDG